MGIARFQQLPLQAKITGVILAVLLAVFSLIPVSIHLFVKPLILDEIRRIGVSTGSTLVDEIYDQRLLAREDAGMVIEDRMRELLYLQPNIRRLEVYRFNAQAERNVLIANSVEEQEPDSPRTLPVLRKIQTDLRLEDSEAGERGWEIRIPIPSRNSPKKISGVARIVVSIGLVSQMVNLLTRVSVGAALLGAFLLTSLLSFALRRTMANDRKLRVAESENRVLSRQLQETEKQVLNLEKLAVMGQLTANFAHEIGTPLNAIGGHLSLLREEVGEAADGRIRVMEGQVRKISEIVHGFLQSTAKPASQRQLVDPHRVMETTLQIVQPLMDGLQVRTERKFDRALGPVRMVPIELEQILLNLINNSLDSLREKADRDEKFRPALCIATAHSEEDGQAMVEITVRDNGVGIPEADLKDVQKPFFTTKAPGQGTGLGLSICRDILKRYHGSLDLRSRAGEWTEASVKIPYRRERQETGNA